MINWVLVFLALIPIVLLLLRVVYRPPSLDGRSVSQSVPISDATAIGRAVQDQARGRDHDSGIVALHVGIKC